MRLNKIYSCKQLIIIIKRYSLKTTIFQKCSHNSQYIPTQYNPRSRFSNNNRLRKRALDPACMAVADKRSSQWETIFRSPQAQMNWLNQSVPEEISGLLMNIPWETVVLADINPWGALEALSSNSFTSEILLKDSTTKGHNINRDQLAETSLDQALLKKLIVNSPEWAWQIADSRHLLLQDPLLMILETVLLTHTVKKSRITKHVRETSRFFKKS